MYLISNTLFNVFNLIIITQLFLFNIYCVQHIFDWKVLYA